MALPAKSPGDFAATGTYTAANFNDQINAIYTWGQGAVDAHLAATTGHGATGAVVGTTNTQTLTGKTLTTPVVASLYQDVGKTKLMSLPNTASDTIVTLAATQEISNKTLLFPIVYNPQEVMAVSATVSAGKTSIMCTAAGITVTLPTAALAVAGIRITVTDTTGTAGSSPITLVGQGGETIGNVAAGAQIVEDLGSITVEGYNTKWWIV